MFVELDLHPRSTVCGAELALLARFWGSGSAQHGPSARFPFLHKQIPRFK
jgi:hypothetical protein